MAKMINYDGNLIRISSEDSTRLEYSTNEGKSWTRLYHNPQAGEFCALTDNGKELLGTTSKGLYYSKNEGKSWSRK